MQTKTKQKIKTILKMMDNGFFFWGTILFACTAYIAALMVVLCTGATDKHRSMLYTYNVGNGTSLTTAHIFRINATCLTV